METILTLGVLQKCVVSFPSSLPRSVHLTIMSKPLIQHHAPFIVPKHLIGDPKTTILDLYDWNAVHNPDAPVLRYLDTHGVNTLTWKETNDATHRAATFFLPFANSMDDIARPVFAIFANTGAKFHPW